MDEIAFRLPARRTIMAGMNAAVNDALYPLGVRLTELPMTPERILSALRAAGPVGDSAG